LILLIIAMSKEEKGTDNLLLEYFDLYWKIKDDFGDINVSLLFTSNELAIYFDAFVLFWHQVDENFIPRRKPTPTASFRGSDAFRHIDAFRHFPKLSKSILSGSRLSGARSKMGDNVSTTTAGYSLRFGVFENLHFLVCIASDCAMR
jgi:hypothetical protein